MRGGRVSKRFERLSRSTRRDLYSLVRLIGSLSLNVARRIPRSADAVPEYVEKTCHALACLASFQKVLVQRLSGQQPPRAEDRSAQWFQELVPSVFSRRKYAISAPTGEKRLLRLLDSIIARIGLLDTMTFFNLPPSSDELWEFHALVTSVMDQLAWYLAYSLAPRLWPESAPNVG